MGIWNEGYLAYQLKYRLLKQGDGKKKSVKVQPGDHAEAKGGRRVFAMFVHVYWPMFGEGMRLHCPGADYRREFQRGPWSYSMGTGNQKDGVERVQEIISRALMCFVPCWPEISLLAGEMGAVGFVRGWSRPCALIAQRRMLEVASPSSVWPASTAPVPSRKRLITNRGRVRSRGEEGRP